MDYIRPFVASTQSVFTTMLGLELQRVNFCAIDADRPSYEVNGVIGFAGGITGNIVLSMTSSLAWEVVSGLLQAESPDTEELVDAVSELTNMIAGGAKSRLRRDDLKITLPSVLLGENGLVKLPGVATTAKIDFNSNHGPLTVSIGLLENQLSA
ncbi:MAG: chemotaxis protein CheX [Pirellulaceae bacterium]|nr:chemotaxis protein CheX [Pirellulaceae bacterium]MDP7016899.1 chemotaxis protein CheX [Pirellulaceae bacterium]